MRKYTTLKLTRRELDLLTYYLVHSEVGWKKSKEFRGAMEPERDLARLLDKIRSAREVVEEVKE